MSVTEGRSINYQYKLNGTMYVNGYVHESYGTNAANEYYKRIGKHFLVQFNASSPNYSVIYLSCQMDDTITAPIDGWVSSPANCGEYK